MALGKYLAVLVLTTILLGMVAVGNAQAQMAPIPRAIVPVDAAPEGVSEMVDQLVAGENPISIAGAQWLQLQFADFELGPEGVLTITDAAGNSQTFTQSQLEAWEGLTAIFNGSAITVTLTPSEIAPGESATIGANIEEIIIGLPAPGDEGMESVAPDPLTDLFGDDLDQYIAPDSGWFMEEEAPPSEAICGMNDDRVASTHALSGRIMPVGCTGWLIQGGFLLTAGHCTGANMQTVEFNVPVSQANGTTVSPPARDQYRVVTASIVSQNTGIGNDWAIFRVLPNTETGLMPHAAQGGSFQLSNTANPTAVEIVGYGVDGPAPNFGAPPPRNAENQTLQTHNGTLTDHVVSGALARLEYAVDTQGGNSGSPVVIAGGGNVAVGIHTNGGCTTSGGANAGTSFRNQALWASIRGTDDIVWQHREGQVHYWPMLNGQRQGGINIFSPVDGSWTLVGAGDVDGDGTDDLVWQHSSGQVHYWPMLNGQRQGGINIFTPVDGNWRLAGVGDVNGDGTDDIVWQHRNGQVHYWPMLNGQRQGGINIFTPVDGNWTLADVGDVDGDGTDDIVWQHNSGQVHYWPMLNGQRQGGINVYTPVDGNWRVAGVGDVDGDGTDDIVWQHRQGQVHYWPMLNGQRQGGINIFSPVDGSWMLADVGDID